MDYLVWLACSTIGGICGILIYHAAVRLLADRQQQWPKVITVGGARVTVFRNGMMVFRRADGTLWAENLRHRDREWRHSEAHVTRGAEALH
jgi:hypothetical protein